MFIRKPQFRILLLSILCVLAAVPCALAQKHVIAVARRVADATDPAMGITNVVKRSPRTRQVTLRVLAVENLSPKFIREMAKALDKDAGSAVDDKTSSSDGVVTRVMCFADRKGRVSVILSYGPYGGSLVVREDFNEGRAGAMRMSLPAMKEYGEGVFEERIIYFQ